MGLEIKEGYEYNKEIRELFTEYADLVIAGDKSFMEYLKMQHFDQEIEHLEEKYGYPNGRLYIAFYDGSLAGCIGLKKLHNEVCEMKRLYVKPEFRGKHIGYSLAKKVINDGFVYYICKFYPKSSNFVPKFLIFQTKRQRI